RVMSREQFESSIYGIGSCYCYQKNGVMAFRQYLTATDCEHPLGPCFEIASEETGSAGMCSVTVQALSRDPATPPVCSKQEVLVTDTPSLVAYRILGPEDFHRLAAFKLLCTGRELGILSTNVRPEIDFTSEGGIEMPLTFEWVSSAEQELGNVWSD